MPIYIRTYDLSEKVPADIIKWCRRNNFSTCRKSDGNGCLAGIMRETLNERIAKKEGNIILAHDGINPIGWGLAYGAPHGWYYKSELQIYVQPRHRRKGIGARILKKATQIRGKVAVYPHKLNEGFYESYGLTKNETITGSVFKKKKCAR